MEDRIASYLALANKAGKVVSGSDLVAEILKKKSSVKKYLLLATDISEDIGNRMRGLAELHGVQHATIFTKDRFGELLGKGLRSVVAVQGDGFVDTMNKEIDRYRNFLRGEGCTYE
jgi:ribosomal protein L7Ae-like RNA K-turn-binding protein